MPIRYAYTLHAPASYTSTLYLYAILIRYTYTLYLLAIRYTC
jgi:hypothetical protein